MNFIRHAKMTIGPALTKLASVGLIVGIGSIANGAMSAPAPQDHDHKAHKVELKKLHTDKDENVEVIVIREGDSGHQDMLKKLKKEHNIEIKSRHGDQDKNVEVFVIGDGDSDHKDLLKKLKTEHKIEIKELHGDHAGDVEVVVVKGDEDHGDIKKMIHGHLGELLHGQGSPKVDYHEMANQLREIADRLDGKGHSGNKKHGHHGDIEIHHGGIHGVHVWKHAGSDKANNDDVEIVTGTGKRFQIRKSGQPHEMIIEVTPEGNPKVHALHGDHKKILLHRAKDHDPAHNVFVEEIHVDKKHKKRGDATTSDENDLSTLEQLRAELDALRSELHQFRSKRPEAQKKRVRHKKKDLSSADDKGNNRLVWVAEDDIEKSGNTFVWSTDDGSVEKMSPNRVRFEFKKKDADSMESSSDKK